MIDEDLDTDEVVLSTAAPEKAFRNEFEWKGVKLNRYSFTRKTAAEMLGLKWGVTLKPDDIFTMPNPKVALLKQCQEKLAEMLESQPVNRKAIKKLKSTINELEKILSEKESVEASIYKGMTVDAAIVIWLCLQPDSKCHKARRRPQEFEGEIDRWADENINTAESEGDAIKLFIEIVNDELASTGQPDTEKGQPDPN